MMVGMRSRSRVVLPFAALYLLLFVLVPASVAAQEVVPISGRVLAGEGRTPVPAARVAAGNVRVTTNRAGEFQLSVPAGPLRLTATADGYQAQQVDVVVTPGMGPIEIQLAASQGVREEVTVSAEGGSGTPAPASIAVTPSAVLRVAGAGDNIFKALQTLPGISATDDFGSRLAVRGGGPDQNLTVMDGVEIHNPYRLFGLTSAFNPETVDRFELTAGGFGPEYGDRLSSILVVENRAGTTREAFAGSAAISFTDANVVFEGKLPGRARGSWLVTGRRTYYDLVADRITGNDLPSFGDVQMKGTWEVRPGHAVTVFGLRSREKTDATFTDSGDAITVGDDSRNDLVSLNYRAAIGARLSARSTLAWYDYGDTLGVDASVRDDARRSNNPDPEAGRRAAIVFTRGLGVRDVSFRQQVDVQAGRQHLVGAGFDVHALRTTWGWSITGDRNSSVANGSAVIGGAGLPSLLDSRRDSTRAALWLVDRIQIGSRIRLAPGLRLDRSGVNDEVALSPRLSMDVDLGRKTRLKGALGRFTQSPGYEKLLQSDYFVDLTSDTASALRSERATHAILGIEHAVSASVTARVEGYSKRFSRLVIGRLETAVETAARVERYAFPPVWQDSVPVEPQITSLPVNGGGGHAYGFDVYVEKRQLRPSDRVSGWASYTWGRANQRAYDVTRPFDYDRRHSISVVSTIGVFSRLDVGATVRVASGFPTTTPVGLRIAADEAEDGRLVPAVDDAGLPIWTVNFGGVSNLARGHLPVYARLDLRFTFKPKNPAGRWQVYLELLNALNRKNVSTLEPALQYDPSSDRPRIDYASDSGLPLLPSFGFRYRF